MSVYPSVCIVSLFTIAILTDVYWHFIFQIFIIFLISVFVICYMAGQVFCQFSHWSVCIFLNGFIGSLCFFWLGALSWLCEWQLSSPILRLVFYNLLMVYFNEQKLFISSTFPLWLKLFTSSLSSLHLGHEDSLFCCLR